MARSGRCERLDVVTILVWLGAMALDCPSVCTCPTVVVPWRTHPHHHCRAHARARTHTCTPCSATSSLSHHRRRGPTALARPLPPLRRVTNPMCCVTTLLLATVACAKSPACALPSPSCPSTALPLHARLCGAMRAWPHLALSHITLLHVGFPTYLAITSTLDDATLLPP